MPNTQSQGFDGNILYRSTFILYAIRMHCKFHTAYIWSNGTIHSACYIKDVNPIHSVYSRSFVLHSYMSLTCQYWGKP